MDTDEKKQECFLNGMNDGLAYALESRDFQNFQAMVDKALVLENRRGVMEKKRKLQQGSGSPVLDLHQLDLPSVLVSRVFNRGLSSPARIATPRSVQ